MKVGRRLGRMVGAGLSALAMVACGSPAELGDGNETGGDESGSAETRQTLETNYDAPVAAAVEVGAKPAHKKLLVFACDWDGWLRMGVKTGSSWEWQALSAGCESPPTVGKWRGGTGNDQYDSVFVYARYDDGHVWELWFPDVRDLASRHWGDVSVHSGFGSVAGAPVIVQTTSTPQTLSLAVKKASNNGLYVLEWANETMWTTTKVYRSGTSGLAVVTPNTISARGSVDGSPGFITGRGWDGTNDTVAWYAPRWVVDGKYYRYPDRDTTLDGTPFMASAGTWTGLNRWVGKSGNQLEILRFEDNTWYTSSSCFPAGSPRGATMQDPSVHAYRVYMRGGVSPDVKNDLISTSSTSSQCTSHAGAVYSAVTVVEHGTEDYFYSDALYKGASSKLYYFDRSAGTHANLGLTLP